MNSALEFIYTHKMSQDDWLAYRYSGIGASEVGTIMGLDDYKSSIELFYEKIGQGSRYTLENLAMFLGKEQEDFIASMWQHWDGTVDGMIANYRAGKIVRRCQRVNAYVRNPKYPWLFVSLDRKINKHGSKGEGSLEIKTMNGREADKWDAGIPPKYVVQLQTQMLVCEFDYGEMAIMEDNRKFEVIPFERVQGICDGVIEHTQRFWLAVQQATKLNNAKFEAERNFNYKEAGRLQAEIDSLAPAPDGSMAYANFLKEKFRDPQHSERLGNVLELEWARKHAGLSEEIKQLSEQKQLFENQLKNALGDVQRLSFGDDGSVYWTKTKTGSRMFRNKVTAI